MKMTVDQKKRFVAEINYKLKTFFKYIAKIDSVYEEFNRTAKPISWADWFAKYSNG